MAEIATVARPYAEALFRIAKQGNMAAWSELLSELAQVAAHPDVQAFVANPNLSDADTIGVLTSLVKAPVTPEARNFLQVLAENGRIALLPEIAVQFEELKNADAGAADATISSAFALESAQVGPLVATLEKKFGRKLNPTLTVDPSLIGGVRVIVGDEVLDTSVRAKLQQMYVALVA